MNTDKKPPQEQGNRFLQLLEGMGRLQRRWVKLGIDVGLTVVSLWTAFAMRLGELAPPLDSGFFWLLPLILGMRLPAFAWLGLYRSNLLMPGPDASRRILIGVAISLAGTGLPLFFFQPAGFPRSVVIIEASVSSAFLIAAREGMRALLAHLRRRYRRCEPVVIYGAGNAGLQLASSLARDERHEYMPVGFVDDDPVKQGLRIEGIEVYSPEQLPVIVRRFRVRKALLAIPSLPGWKRQPLLDHLNAAGLEVSTVPSLIDLISGRVELKELGAVSADDLLGREAVPPDPRLIRADVAGKRVLVTGAGGSIGSELCRQIAALGPEALVLVESCEFALYQIEQELAERFPDVRLAAILGSVTDQDRMSHVCCRFLIETVYHAAAYKHVPLVEQNPIQGIWNNAIGTWRMAQAALVAGVRTFVLVSTDKAVRPTSVMGATKRAAELAVALIGARAAEKAQCEGLPAPRFVIVRFGNVLDSTGSVVPLFRRQIDRGGPVTVTHPDVTRYFMTIPEAAQLVLQAGALAEGGEVFLLEMGRPVRIVELAERMIALTLPSAERRIAIKFTGLRPGEKLVEELLTDPSRCERTCHSKIYRAREEALAAEDIAPLIRAMEQAAAGCNDRLCCRLLAQLVPDYCPASAPSDIALCGETAYSFARQRRSLAAAEAVQEPAEASPSPSLEPERESLELVGP